MLWIVPQNWRGTKITNECPEMQLPGQATRSRVFLLQRRLKISIAIQKDFALGWKKNTELLKRQFFE